MLSVPALLPGWCLGEYPQHGAGSIAVFGMNEGVFRNYKNIYNFLFL